MKTVINFASEEGLKELYRRAKALSDEVAGDLGDVVALIPEGASTENKLATADDISTIEEVIPEGAAADNQLVTESKLETELSKLGGFVVALPDSQGYPDVSTPNPKMIYLVLDSSAPQPDQYKEWIWVLTEAPDVYEWKCIGDTSVDLSGYYTKGETDGLLGGKVDKVTGKGLSTNDYTDADQQKLGGIAAGAQVNVIETVKVNGAALTPVEKAVDITVPAAANDGTLTLKQNNVQVGTFSANQAGDTIINVTDTTYESKAESQGGNAVSLVTTGEKYSWNHALDAINEVVPSGASSSNKLATANDVAAKQDILTFNGTYDASTNPVATVDTVTTAVSGKEDASNKVTTIHDASTATDTAYPSEKAVATALAEKASTATTLAGYGITDASITESQGTRTVTLGNDSLVPMLSASAPLSASGNSLSLTHTTATFTTYVDSGDGTPLAVDENTPLLADEVELVDSIGGKELLARRACQDEDGNNIKTGKASSISLAPEFSPSIPYAKDEVVMYGGELRKFTSAHPAGNWSVLDNKAIDIITLLKEMNTKMKTFTLFAPTGASYQLTNGSTRVSAHFTQGSDTVLALDPVSTMVNAKAGFKAGDTIRITGMQIKAAGGAGLQVPAVDSTSSPAINGKAGTLSLKLVEVDSTGAAASGGATLSFAASVVEWDNWEEKDISLTVPELSASGAGFSIQVDSASAYECDDYNLQDAYKDQYVKPELLVQVEVDRLVKLSDGTDIV